MSLNENGKNEEDEDLPALNCRSRIQILELKLLPENSNLGVGERIEERTTDEQDETDE